MPGSHKDKPAREWLSEGEIRSIAHDEIRDAVMLQTDILNDFKKLLDKIADGAQAQIFSATILHGNREMGVKGAIPEMQERLAQLEEELLQVKASQKENSNANEHRFEQTTARLDSIEDNQNRTRRAVKAACRWAITNPDGTADWKRMAGIAGACGLAFRIAGSHMPTWLEIRHALAWLAELAGDDK